MRANSVSEPIRVARITRRPFRLRDEPITSEPTATSIGMDSPVSMELSTALAPEITIPSVAIRSPGFAMNSSPTSKWAIGIKTISPLRSTDTSLVPSANSVDSALLARFFARDSKNRPAITKVITVAETSA